MVDVRMRYMTIQAVFMTTGMDFECWLSTVEFWTVEREKYPHDYTYVGEACTWLLRSNVELTPKIIVMAGEQADRICSTQIAINNTRKLSNR